MKKSTESSLKEKINSSLASLASAFKKGPAEKAGEKIDRAALKMKNAAREAMDGFKKSR